MPTNHTTPDQRTMSLEILRRLRERMPSPGVALSNDLVASGFRIAAIQVLAAIEAATPEHELWTNLPDIADARTVGDHIAVTRKALGITP